MGWNPGAEERFIGVDVPDAADESLVQQQRLDAGSAAAKIAGEVQSGDLERLRAEAAHASGEILVHLNGAELAAVVKLEHAAVQREDGVGVFARRAASSRRPVMPRCSSRYRRPKGTPE